MRAAVFDSASRRLEVQGVPDPEPGSGEVLVRVQACGICLSDVHLLDGTLPSSLERVTPGHEPAGVIERLGEGVPEHWGVGARVLMAAGKPCGRCPNCVRGYPPRSCLAPLVMGFEVAQLANVGLTWYTWLEQGRDVHPSDSVLSAIADALRLDVHEREHLFTLAHGPDQGGGSTRLATAPDLDDLVQGFEPWPAYAISSRFDVLAHNRTAALLFGDLRPGQSGPANMMRLGFTDPAWRELIVDWEQEAARHVAMYRAAMTPATLPGPSCPTSSHAAPRISPAIGHGVTSPAPNADSNASVTPPSAPSRCRAPRS